METREHGSGLALFAVILQADGHWPDPGSRARVRLTCRADLPFPGVRFADLRANVAAAADTAGTACERG
jgi:hypothetical protein